MHLILLLVLVGLLHQLEVVVAQRPLGARHASATGQSAIPVVWVVLDLGHWFVQRLLAAHIELCDGTVVARLSDAPVEGLLERLVVGGLLLRARREDLLDLRFEFVRIPCLESLERIPVCVVERLEVRPLNWGILCLCFLLARHVADLRQVDIGGWGASCVLHRGIALVGKLAADGARHALSLIEHMHLALVGSRNLAQQVLSALPVALLLPRLWMEALRRRLLLLGLSREVLSQVPLVELTLLHRWAVLSPLFPWGWTLVAIVETGVPLLWRTREVAWRLVVSSLPGSVSSQVAIVKRRVPLLLFGDLLGENWAQRVLVVYG